MASTAAQYWRQVQLTALDQIQAAHAAVAGTGPGRRTRTEQLNGAYIVSLAGQFQMFSRNLHSEAAAAMASVIADAALRDAVIAAMTQGRALDRGNVDPGNIGKDFSRLKMAFWNDVEKLDARNEERKGRLRQLNIWRNGVAHQDFDFNQDQLNVLKDTRATLQFVRVWRRACNSLVGQFDVAVRAHLMTLTGKIPWP